MLMWQATYHPRLCPTRETQKKVPQQYGNDHSQLICSFTLRQPKEAPKITLGTRSLTGQRIDRERRPGSGATRGSSASASTRPIASAIARPSTENAPWAYFVPPSKANTTAASAAREKTKGLHGPSPRAYIGTTLMLHVSWPVFKQHEAYRKAYQLTTVRDVRRALLTCKDDGSDLPSNYFPSPVQILRNDLVLQVTHRSLFRLDVDVASHLSSKTLSNKGTQKRVPQQYGNDHPQLICSFTLRQPKEAPKITLGTRYAL